MSELFESIMRGLNEALEYEKGNLKNVKRHRIIIAELPQYKSDKIRAIRMGLKLSQQSFASVMGVSKKTVEAWEAGRNTPEGPAQRMLELLEKEPEIIEKYELMKHI